MTREELAGLTVDELIDRLLELDREYRAFANRVAAERKKRQK